MFPCRDSLRRFWLQRLLISSLILLPSLFSEAPHAESSAMVWRSSLGLLTHTVKRGETLTAIAKRYDTTVAALKRRNGISNVNQIQVGQRLVVPFSEPTRHFRWPLSKIDVSSEFGSRGGRHKGIDLRAPRGTPILAAASGKVLFSGKMRGYGRVVIIEHEDGFRTLYGHNDRNMAKKGQRVWRGSMIATVGRSGNATGNHLHFELIHNDKRVDPRDYIRASSW